MSRGTRVEHSGRTKHFAYGALTLYGGAFQHASTHSNRPSEEPAGPSNSALQPRADNGCSLSRPRSLGSSPFARRYSGNHSLVFSSSGYLDVSVPRVSVFRQYIFNILGCPIQKSTGQKLFAPLRSLSQLITSFIASESLGIHHMLLVTY